ncbi:MAG TPA: galactonate dehydratase [Caulobacteraceae bacterium]|nr:galactonate dehydratase [Caulobacteraceae bacterium]
MKISRILAYPVAGPLTDLCFVKVEADDGSYGWGEASIPGKGPAVAQAVRDLGPMLLGMDPLATEHCWQRIYRHSYWRGGPILTASISGVDTALWDLKGKVYGAPLHQLLGGPVRERIWLYANLGLSSDPGELRDRAAKAVAQGYTAVKFYPLPPVGPLEGPSSYRMVASCAEAVREEIGSERSFCLDFHGRCSATVAVQMEAAVRHTRPLWIEEPVAAENIAGLKRCAEKFEVALALGERLFTRWAFREVLEQRLADVLQPDVANAGGVSEMMRIAAMAELYGVAFAPHNPNGPVQAQASLHLAAASPAFSILEHRHDLVEAMSAFASPSPRAGADGWADLPKGPGLGIELDEAWLAGHPADAHWTESFRRDGSVGDW